jgi:hypothetical protein
VALLPFHGCRRGTDYDRAPADVWISSGAAALRLGLAAPALGAEEHSAECRVP